MWSIRNILKNKMISVGIAAALIAAGYFGYRALFGADTAIRYATAQVRKGTLVVSLSGSGQVSASNQVEIKSKVSGDAVYVGVVAGQDLRQGALLAQLDTGDAEKAVRDAEVNLESAKLALEKLQKPADALAMLQAENALAQAQESQKKGLDDREKSYEDGFNTVANAFLTLPDVMAGLNTILLASTLGADGQWNMDYYADTVKIYEERSRQYREDAYADYQTARKAYDQNFSDYKSASRFSDPASIRKLIDETYLTAKNIAEAVKSASNLIQFYKDKLIEKNLKSHPAAEAHLASISGYTGTTNTHLLNLFSAKQSVQAGEEAILNTERSVAEKTESLAKLKSGTDILDIRSAELSVIQRENALLDAREKMADFFLRVPFDGVIAKLNLKRGDAVSPAAAVATLITRQKIAEISLNEVDVAKIKVGQKTTLTFDAIPDLTIAGQVAEIDTVGTIAQGVVTYTVKIGFDTQDDRVKTAMSVLAAIVTEAKPDVLLIPNSAVKSQAGANYVEVPANAGDASLARANAAGTVLINTPRRRPIEVGSADDEFTEIAKGLNEGDTVIIRTIQPSAAQSAATQSGSGVRIPGLPGGGGFRGGGSGR